jgi:hypothetical protein
MKFACSKLWFVCPAGVILLFTAGCNVGGGGPEAIPSGINPALLSSGANAHVPQVIGAPSAGAPVQSKKKKIQAAPGPLEIP